MTEIETTSGDALVPYERGLPLSKTVRATLQYFLPGAAICLTTGLMVLAGGLPTGAEWIDTLTMIGGGVGVLSLGFFAC